MRAAPSEWSGIFQFLHVVVYEGSHSGEGGARQFRSQTFHGLVVESCRREPKVSGKRRLPTTQGKKARRHTELGFTITGGSIQVVDGLLCAKRRSEDEVMRYRNPCHGRDKAMYMITTGWGTSGCIVSIQKKIGAQDQGLICVKRNLLSRDRVTRHLHMD